MPCKRFTAAFLIVDSSGEIKLRPSKPFETQPVQMKRQHDFLALEGFNFGNIELEEDTLNALKSALIIAFTYSQAKECTTPHKLNLFFRKL